MPTAKKDTAAKKAVTTDQEQERTVLCYWCLGSGQVKKSARTTKPCTHCRGSGIILADTPMPGHEVEELETVLKEYVEGADSEAGKPSSKRSASSSRAAKKRTRKTAAKTTTKKTAANKSGSAA